MNNEFFVLKYAPNGADTPYFFETEWLPELPEFHYPTENPKNLNNEYQVKAEIEFLNADYLPDQFLASRKFIDLCDELDVKTIHRKVEINGLQGSIQNYFFFAPAERISLLDESRSEFSRETDKHTGRPAISSEEDGQFPVYEAIDLFMTLPSSAHLFFCRELKELVCSKEFQTRFIETRMKGISFESIDNDFRYSPWGVF
ncbi:imm11 family protein [Pseudomonas sp. NPDC089996]|uniref:imm11 family protein n=1 Tax=Pseudomonas sp. NPDC089996 TaxID=3364474 RepID=UPI0038270ABD